MFEKRNKYGILFHFYNCGRSSNKRRIFEVAVFIGFIYNCFFALKNENKCILITGDALAYFTGTIGFFIFYMLLYVYKLRRRI